MLKSFRELEVWRRSHGVVLDIYRLTSAFPKDERFGIVSQLRRAAYSVPANIAEGFGRSSTKELIQFLVIANGSLQEVRYFIYLSSDLGYLAKHDSDEMEKKLDSVAQMIAALSRSLRKRIGTAGSSRITNHGPRITHISTQAN